jgi:hypothetical protein
MKKPKVVINEPAVMAALRPAAAQDNAAARKWLEKNSGMK